MYIWVAIFFFVHHPPQKKNTCVWLHYIPLYIVIYLSNVLQSNIRSWLRNKKKTFSTCYALNVKTIEYIENIFISRYFFFIIFTILSVIFFFSIHNAKYLSLYGRVRRARRRTHYLIVALFLSSLCCIWQTNTKKY